jgi:endonuclease/exonuclease/phosphatase family metal-dependent hydrolase
LLEFRLQPALLFIMKQNATPETNTRPRGRRVWRRIAIATVLIVAIPGLLFVINGVFLARGETPELHLLSDVSVDSIGSQPLTVKVFAFNIAKCFVFKDGEGLEDVSTVNSRLDRIAALIRAEDPDLVFLSETIVECGPCPVDQVGRLAKATGMHAWAFGENFNFGIPYFRVVGGNAILARRPVETVANPSLAGRRPFYAVKNNRRVLWCATQIAGRRVLLASIHTDSFNRDNNLRQTRQILDFAGGQPALLAGDFNALPDWPSIELIRDSGHFSGAFDGELTFPADRPDRRLDYIFAPADWELVDEHVVVDDVSDHRAVVSTFRVR